MPSRSRRRFALGAAAILILDVVSCNKSPTSEIERAIQQRHPRAIMMLSGPPRTLLQSSSRWPALAKLMNLPEQVA
jgi:hypothetical protein